MRQGNCRVYEYILDFQLYTRGMGWNDIDLIEHFWEGLTDELKDQLMKQGTL